MSGNSWLIAGGILSLTAALAHIAVIFGGPDWYRFFGAGEAMARAAASGSVRPVIVTLAVATLLAIWAAYAFSGAGVIAKLPLLKPALVAISGIYLLRGLVFVYPPLFARPDLGGNFIWISSLIVLAFGIVHATGTWLTWHKL